MAGLVCCCCCYDDDDDDDGDDDDDLLVLTELNVLRCRVDIIIRDGLFAFPAFVIVSDSDPDRRLTTTSDADPDRRHTTTTTARGSLTI